MAYHPCQTRSAATCYLRIWSQRTCLGLEDCFPEVSRTCILQLEPWCSINSYWVNFSHLQKRWQRIETHGAGNRKSQTEYFADNHEKIQRTRRSNGHQDSWEYRQPRRPWTSARDPRVVRVDPTRLTISYEEGRRWRRTTTGGYCRKPEWMILFFKTSI